MLDKKRLKINFNCDRLKGYYLEGEFNRGKYNISNLG